MQDKGRKLLIVFFSFVVLGCSGYLAWYYTGVYRNQDADEKAVVYITEKSRDYLKLFLEVRKEYAEKCGYDGKALFISKNGRRLSQSALSDIIRTASDNEVTPHMLRHYYGTQLYRVTQDIVLVQQQLRHESIETAVSYYVAINIEDRMEKIARMNQI